jgi:hypothetical protein
VASPVYTVLLGEADLILGNTVVVPSPPPGFRFVITDMEAENSQAPDVPSLGGFSAFTPSFFIVWAVSTFALRGISYHWRGRQVIDVGDELEFATDDVDWHVRVTGFQLTLP